MLDTFKSVEAYAATLPKRKGELVTLIEKGATYEEAAERGFGEVQYKEALIEMKKFIKDYEAPEADEKDDGLDIVNPTDPLAPGTETGPAETTDGEATPAPVVETETIPAPPVIEA